MASMGNTRQINDVGANSRGRVYACMTCHNYQGEKSKVVKHFYKKHVAYDQVPYYCSICKFVTSSQKELEDHIMPHTFPAHAAIVKVMREAGEEVNEHSSLLQNTCHYIITDEDIKRLSKDSDLEFAKRRRHSDIVQCALKESDILLNDTEEENILPQIIGNHENMAFSPSHNDVVGDSFNDEDKHSSITNDEKYECCERCQFNQARILSCQESIVTMGQAMSAILEDLKNIQNDIKEIKDEKKENLPMSNTNCNQININNARRFIPYPNYHHQRNIPTHRRRNVFNRPQINKHIRF